MSSNRHHWYTNFTHTRRERGKMQVYAYVRIYTVTDCAKFDGIVPCFWTTRNESTVNNHPIHRGHIRLASLSHVQVITYRSKEDGIYGFTCSFSENPHLAFKGSIQVYSEMQGVI